MTAVRPALLASALAALLAVACGGGGTTAEQSTEVAQSADDVEQYCSLSAELDAQDGPPSDEQLTRIEQIAPAEIAEDVATLVAAVRAEEFDDPEVQDAETALLAWEEENCVQPLDEEPGGEPTEAATP